MEAFLTQEDLQCGPLLFEHVGLCRAGLAEDAIQLVSERNNPSSPTRSQKKVS